MKEKDVERYLIDAIERMGGRCVKLVSQGNNGIPDRLCLLPGGRAVFIELKRPTGGRLSPVQDVQQKRLRALGFEVHTLSSREAIDAWEARCREV